MIPIPKQHKLKICSWSEHPAAAPAAASAAAASGGNLTPAPLELPRAAQGNLEHLSAPHPNIDFAKAKQSTSFTYCGNNDEKVNMVKKLSLGKDTQADIGYSQQIR